MLRSDHPHAKWLSELYGSGIDHGVPPVEEVLQKFSPEFVIHTGGVRLATSGGRALLADYARRRRELGHPLPSKIHQVLADDHFGIVYAEFRAERAGTVMAGPGMGAWRFEDGLAVEHWEMPDGPQWDEFYRELVPPHH
ncbi:hypothetical protein GCM10022222_33900 [Amycolatopsis ultiminotia]|uniref:SnoaL-like domain-containing protein n=1 Tax=Amycolatopsis ultiminotia TaxID=543629 RepID=A0ABP6W972_9PSEU